MNTLRHGSRARFAAVGIVASGALLLAGCGASNEAPPSGGAGASNAPTVAGTIAGAGASSQQAAQEAERIVGHPLPGKLIQGASLESYRRKLAA